MGKHAAQQLPSRQVALLAVGALMLVLSACGGADGEHPAVGASAHPSRAGECPTRLSTVTTTTVRSEFDLTAVAAGPAGTIVIGKEDPTNPDLFTARFIRLPDGKTTDPTLLSDIADNTEVYDHSAGRAGFAIVTDTMTSDDRGHSALVTFFDPDGRVVWEKKAADGGTIKADPDGDPSYDDDSGRWAVQIVNDTVYVDTDAGIQAYAASDGSTRKTPSFLDRLALLPGSVVWDHFTVADEDAVKGRTSDGVAAQVLTADGSEYTSYQSARSIIGYDGSHLADSDGGKLNLEVPGAGSTPAPPPGRATSWDDVEDPVAVCGTHLYSFDGSEVTVSTPPNKKPDTTLSLPDAFEDTDISDDSIIISSRSVAVVNQSISSDNDVVLTFAIAARAS